MAKVRITVYAPKALVTQLHNLAEEESMEFSEVKSAILTLGLRCWKRGERLNANPP